jgi:hypothetical protein
MTEEQDVNNTQRASDDMRRINYQYVKMRDDWRFRYNTVSSEITFLKSVVAAFPTRRNQYLLRIHREKAAELMYEREVISFMLKSTSYKYC